MAVSPALSGFLAKGHLSRVSCQPLLSANDKDANEMIPGGCAQISWHLPRRPSMKAVRPVIVSKGAPSHQLRSVGSLSTSVRKRGGKKRKGRVGGNQPTFILM